MKQPVDVHRDLDDEVAEAVEHQYARRLVKSATAQKRAGEPARVKMDKKELDEEVERGKAASGANLSHECNG